MIIPEEWRLLRGLLNALALLALVAATLSLSSLSWPRGPLWFAVVSFIAAPVLLGAGALLVADRFERVRRAGRVVTVTSALVVAVNVGQLFMFKHFIDELRDLLPPRCGPALDDCDKLLARKFGKPAPKKPATSAVGDFRFQYAEESGRLLSYSYAASPREERKLVWVVARRRPGGFEPPVDETTYITTPGGAKVVEGVTPKGISRLDFWDDSYHYAVSLQNQLDRSSPEYLAALGLVDATR